MIKISAQGYPDLPHQEIDTDAIPSSWYGELARCYFRDWYIATLSASARPVESACIRVEGSERAYTFGVTAVETLTFKVTGGD